MIRRRDNERRPVDISIDLGILLYEIENETWLRGRSVAGKEKADIRITPDPGVKERVFRSLQSAYTEIENLLGEYLRGQRNDRTNELWQHNKDISIRLWLPDNYETSSIDSVTQSIHSYLRDKSVADWYSITNVEEAKLYASRAEQASITLRESISRRRRPRPPHFRGYRF